MAGTDWRGRARKAVLGLKPYEPGKPIEEVQRELGLDDVIKLASNENPLGPSPKAVEAAKRAVELVNYYPEDTNFELKRALAVHHDVPEDWIAIGRGSDEVLLLTVLAFLDEGDEVIYADTSFVMYEFLGKLAGATCKAVPLTSDLRHDLEAMAAQVTERTKLVFIANPNNPTGTIVYQDEMEALMAALPPGVLVAFDEAYWHYVDHSLFPNVLQFLKMSSSGNVLLLRTFSKSYGLAGLRIGYGIGAPEVIRLINSTREPFNVSNVAQAAAVAALGDKEFLERTVQENQCGREFLTNELKLLGCEVIPSQANFVFVDVRRDGRLVFEELLKRGVIVRTGDVFGMPTYLRITVGRREQNERLVAALREVLEICEMN